MELQTLVRPTLDPELIEFILAYYQCFFTTAESKASKLLLALTKMNMATIVKLERDSHGGFNCYASDKEATDLLRKGAAIFQRQVAERIYIQHRNELDINRCPSCNKVARTPYAKQCRFCYYDWH